MIRRLLLWGAAGLLSACGSDTVHAPAPLGMLVKPGSAPWLSVAGGDDRLTVRGIDRTVIVEAQPSLAKALQSQLGQQLQADYVQDLVVTCTDLQDALQVDSDKAPDQLVLHLSLHCQLWARGPQSGHDYKIQVSTRVPASAAGEAYGQAFPSLVSEASADLSARLRADIRSLSQRVR